jgi:magnesium-transporting ATPase (P-type)
MLLVEKAGAELVRQQTDYEDSWSRLLEDGYPTDRVVVSESLDLPAPDQLELRLTIIPQLRENTDRRDLVEHLQKKMFIVVAITAVFAIGLPAVVSSVLSKTNRENIKSTFITVAASTALVSTLGLFFEKAFFQDTGQSIGLGIVILIVIGFAQAIRIAPNARDNNGPNG